MNVVETQFPGLCIIEPDIFQDDRGYFYESYNVIRYKDQGIEVDFVQDNESRSAKGVVRGLHYQVKPYAQAKLVRVIKGSVLDVVVDLRKESPGFGKWFSIELSEEDKRQLFIPKGFAHGFLVLEEDTIFSYKCDEYYNRDAEKSINPFDETLAIDWRFNLDNVILSDKDRNAPNFNDVKKDFF